MSISPTPAEAAERPAAPGDTRYLSGWAERALLRHRARHLAFQEIGAGPAIPLGPVVITTPAMPGIPANIRVNDPGEDTGYGDDTTQSEPSIAVSGSDVVVGFNDSTPVGSFSGVAASTDYGQVFTDEGGLLPADESGDPTVVCDSSGVFYYSALVANFVTQESYIGVASSATGGTSFTAATDASSTSGTGKTDFQDKSWLAVDRTGGPGDGNLYLAWTRFIDFDWFGFAANSQVMFSRSTDGGATWTAPINLTPVRAVIGPQGAMPTVGPNGEVYVCWLGRDTSAIEIVRSDDYGVSFANPLAAGGTTPIVSINQIPDTLNGSIRADSFPSIAVDQNSGDVYVAYPAGTGPNTKADVYLVRSADGGASWSTPLRANDDTATVGIVDHWMPSVAVTDGGVVGVMFYDRRNDSASNLNIDVYLAMSVDGGASFLPSRRITTASFPPAVNFDPRIAGNYMGDYNHMVAQGTRFYLVWGDNRDIVGTRNDPNVYFATVGTEDCYVRDNPTDDGSVPDLGPLYISPDISPAMNPSVTGRPNPVTVTVHNMGPLDATDVVVKLYWADPATNIPASAWQSRRIKVGHIPSNQQVIALVPAGGSATIPEPFLWNPPNPRWAAQQGHFCLLAEIESAADPVTFPGGGWEGVERDNNLAVRNVHVIDEGECAPGHFRFLIAGDPAEHWLADVVVDARALPPGVATALTVPEALIKGARLEGLKVARWHHQGGGEDSPAWAEGHGGKRPESGAGRLLHAFERSNVTLEFTSGRLARLSGLDLAPGAQHLVELRIDLNGQALGRDATLHIRQVVGGQAVGGLFYLLKRKR